MARTYIYFLLYIYGGIYGGLQHFSIAATFCALIISDILSLTNLFLNIKFLAAI